MPEQPFAGVLTTVESLYQERLQAYAVWTFALPLMGGVLALVPTFLAARGWVLTLAAWFMLWTFRCYHTWKLRRLVTGPIVGVCGLIEEVGNHGRGHRRSDGLVYPVALQVWFEGNVPLRRGEAITSEVEPSSSATVSLDESSELTAKSDHWYKQLKRTELDVPNPLIIEMTKYVNIARRHSETYWIEGSLLQPLRVGEIAGMIVLSDGTVASVLTNAGAQFPRRLGDKPATREPTP